MSLSFLSTSLHTLKGAGDFYRKQLYSLGLSTFFDLLCHRPTHYDRLYIGTLYKDCHCHARVRIQSNGQGRSPWILQACTEKGQDVDLVFFRPVRFRPHCGQKIWIKGLVTQQKNRLQMAHPHLTLRSQFDLQKTHMLCPVYPLAKGLTSYKIAEWVRMILRQWPCDQQRRPWNRAFHTSWHDALRDIHFPSEPGAWEKAVQTMAFDEMVAMHLSVIQSKYAARFATRPCYATGKITAQIQQRMGYVLTESQQQTWDDIKKDLSCNKPMMRLINGDVGSGKSIMAFLTMAQAVESGRQACLMAPTETLARQHFETLCALLPNHQVHLITGRIKSALGKEPSFVIGTHALFYDGVSFHDLGVVVVDEQQRFGVMQRLRLSEKGHYPHMLFLSATPIPRTFQRAMYGDMDVSTLYKRPCAVPTSSYVMSMDKMDDIVRWCQKVIEKRESIYWVCPTIDHEDEGVIRRYEYWNMIFPGKVGLLHGRLSSQEKDDVMQSFRKGTTSFLISTTVIEVGVHVPQATTIFIENSSQFGLSQLHQLRGRVGRDQWPGHCFFLYRAPIHPVMHQRLHYIKQCHDGFKLAHYDWKMRGAGTPMGTQQSGHKSMKFFSMDRHERLIEPARIQAKKLWDDQCQEEAFLRLFGHQGVRVLNGG